MSKELRCILFIMHVLIYVSNITPVSASSLPTRGWKYLNFLKMFLFFKTTLSFADSLRTQQDGWRPGRLPILQNFTYCLHKTSRFTLRVLFTSWRRTRRLWKKLKKTENPTLSNRNSYLLWWFKLQLEISYQTPCPIFRYTFASWWQPNSTLDSVQSINLSSKYLFPSSHAVNLNLRSCSSRLVFARQRAWRTWHYNHPRFYFGIIVKVFLALSVADFWGQTLREPPTYLLLRPSHVHVSQFLPSQLLNVWNKCIARTVYSVSYHTCAQN